tara:strand:+ start:3630 stop:4475 length:846 start_codon:yes stop_codon:yes gene_type:complete
MKRIAPDPRGKVNVRADFRVGEFEVAIEQQGYRVLWEQAGVCPCRSNKQGGQPNFNCPVCLGAGYEYHSGQEIKAIMDKAHGRQLELNVDGSYHKIHSANFTVLPQHRPSHYHRYTLLDSVMEHSEVLDAPINEALILSYPIAKTQMLVTSETVIGKEREEELYFDVLRCRAMNPTTRKAGRVLNARVDYHIELSDDGDRTIRLDTALSTEFSQSKIVLAITYYMNPRFLVMDYVYSIRDTFVKFKRPQVRYEALPVTVTAQLDVDQTRRVNSGGEYQGGY